MFFATSATLALLAIIPSIYALPAVNPTSAASALVSGICTNPKKNFNPLELDIASLFCSGYLHVKTATISVTSTTVLPQQTSSAIHSHILITNTATNLATATLTSTTSTTLPPSLAVNTILVTPAPITSTSSTTTTLAESIILDTLPAVSITVTTTNTIVIGSTITSHQTQTKTAETFVKRQAMPTQFASFAASVISQACSCLVHTPTSTIHITATSTPPTLAGSIISDTTTISTTIVNSATVTSVITSTIPASTQTVETSTTIPASLAFITQTITAPVITSIQTITPSPVTVTSSTTTYTTSVATATTVTVETVNYEFHLVNGPNNGCFYGANLGGGFIKESDDGSCASNCVNTPGCVTYTTALYVPGGGTACFLFSGAYDASQLNCVYYSDYVNEVVYHLVGTVDTYS